MAEWTRSSTEPIGSALLAHRLKVSLQQLQEVFGVDVPPSGRHREALTLFDRWNQGPGSLDDASQELLDSLGHAHRLAWETFVITVTALEDRQNPRTPFTRKRLNALVGGALLTEGDMGIARNTQFELYVAATFRLPGASVFDGEPDLRLLYGKEEVGIAVKRIRSMRDDQVQKNARDAERQIERQGLRGWIALNLDSRFDEVDATQAESALLADFEASFESIRAALHRPAGKEHVLGFMLYGHVLGWSNSAEHPGRKRLHWMLPIRWEALIDDPAEAALFTEFGTRLSQSWQRRIRTILDPGFDGQL